MEASMVTKPNPPTMSSTWCAEGSTHEMYLSGPLKGVGRLLAKTDYAYPPAEICAAKE